MFFNSIGQPDRAKMGVNPDSERGRSEAEDAADGSEGGRYRERRRARLP